MKHSFFIIIEVSMAWESIFESKIDSLNKRSIFLILVYTDKRKKILIHDIRKERAFLVFKVYYMRPNRYFRDHFRTSLTIPRF